MCDFIKPKQNETVKYNLVDGVFFNSTWTVFHLFSRLEQVNNQFGKQVVDRPTTSTLIATSKSKNNRALHGKLCLWASQER